MQSVLKLAAAGVVLSLVCSACADGLLSPGARRHAVDGTGTASILVRGASYGPNGEEVYPSTCSPTYQLQRDSMDVDWTATGTWWVYETKNKKVGCALQSSNAGETIVGGEVAVAVIHEGNLNYGAVFYADNTEQDAVNNIPLGADIELTAAPWAGYTFMYWTVRRPNGTGFRLYSPTIVRSANSDESEYFAEFIGNN